MNTYKPSSQFKKMSPGPFHLPTLPTRGKGIYSPESFV